MEIALVVIIALQLVYAAYKDYLSVKEREKLELKLISRNAEEYSDLVNPPKNENTKEEVDPYLPIEDATIEQILKAKDRI